ncbi:MAG: hypothetical protein ACXAC5_05560 [Promethearchaeota archaeon]
MEEVHNWNKIIYKNADGSFVQGDKITNDELWESFKIRSHPKFRGACYSHIPVRWTEDVRIMLGKILSEFKDKVEISQIKEKFCRLTVYYKPCSSLGDEAKTRIQELIKECQERLISKGVHPPFNA